MIALALQSTPMTTAQKGMQARVWGQGLTVAAIIGLGLLSQVPTPGDKIQELQEAHRQHSWMHSLASQQPELTPEVQGVPGKVQSSKS